MCPLGWLINAYEDIYALRIVLVYYDEEKHELSLPARPY